MLAGTWLRTCKLAVVMYPHANFSCIMPHGARYVQQLLWLLSSNDLAAFAHAAAASAGSTVAEDCLPWRLRTAAWEQQLHACWLRARSGRDIGSVASWSPFLFESMVVLHRGVVCNPACNSWLLA